MTDGRRAAARVATVLTWLARAWMVSTLAWTAAMATVPSAGFLVTVMFLAYSMGRLDQTRKCIRAHHERTP